MSARTAVDQLVFHRSGSAFTLAGTSFFGRASTRLWQRRLEPWLGSPDSPPAGSPRDGRPSRSLFYAVFADQAALVRRLPGAADGRDAAHVLVGPARTLTAGLALRLHRASWVPARGPLPAPMPRLMAADLAASQLEEEALHRLARSGRSCERLVSLLTRFLSGASEAVVPPVGADAHEDTPYGVLWGLREILGLLTTGVAGAERWSLSFTTYEPRGSGTTPRPPGPGVFARFEEGAAEPPPDPLHRRMAIGLVTAYADSGPRGLRETLGQHAVLSATDLGGRLKRLANLWPAPPPPPASDHGETYVSETNEAPGAAREETRGREVTCPICLSRLDWHKLPLFRWDAGRSAYVPLEVPAAASPEQRTRAMINARVECPNPTEETDRHFLPAAYGRHGTPVVLGFVGTSQAGKTHLLTAMVGAIKDLGAFGVTTVPVDLAIHGDYTASNVEPFLTRSAVLPPTRERVVNFVDAFLIGEKGREPQPVALFDVAGGELTSIDEAKRFLDLADGLIFVADPDLFADEATRRVGDPTFNTVLDLLSVSGRLPRVSAAVVLNKADLVRFDDPVALWLRRDVTGLDADASLEESADVYAYLHARGAQAWTRPYRECPRATLHVVSATGPGGRSGADGVYPRGVSPRRVLGPLAALLAMTGVLSGDEAQRVGV